MTHDPSERRPRSFRGLLTFDIVCLVLLVAYVGAVAASPDPLQPRCDDQVATLPRTAPTSLVFVVTEGDGDAIDPLRAAEYAEDLRPAADRFAFGERIEFVFEANWESERWDAHVAPYRLYESPKIPSAWHSPAAGRMCGNELIVGVTNDRAFNVWKHTHEMGHYFGLPHHDETYMMHDNGNRTPETDKFSSCQTEILSRWETPGNPVRPHWAEKECLTTPAWWQRFWPF